MGKVIIISNVKNFLQFFTAFLLRAMFVYHFFKLLYSIGTLSQCLLVNGIKKFTFVCFQFEKLLAVYNIPYTI